MSEYEKSTEFRFYQLIFQMNFLLYFQISFFSGRQIWLIIYRFEAYGIPHSMILNLSTFEKLRSILFEKNMTGGREKKLNFIFKNL